MLPSGSIHKPCGHSRGGRGVCQMPLFSKMVHKGEGVQNVQKTVHVVYGWPQREVEEFLHRIAFISWPNYARFCIFSLVFKTAFFPFMNSFWYQRNVVGVSDKTRQNFDRCGPHTSFNDWGSRRLAGLVMQFHFWGRRKKIAPWVNFDTFFIDGGILKYSNAIICL